jgi:hypothetical protein
MTCSDCSFHDTETDQCRAMPPTSSTAAGSPGIWPKVLPTHWCAHHQAAQATADVVSPAAE